MKKITFEGVAYYSSCMMLFNLIYLIKLLNEGLFKDKFEVDFRSFSCLVDVNFITFIIVSLMILLSIIFTFFIVFRDDTIKNKNSIGKKVNITSLKDLTSENYFTNYSLLVLTGLSLPVLNEFYTLILYIFVVASLGIVYIKKNLIYMNPILTLLNFSTYSCKDKTTNENYIFIIRNSELIENTTINFQNTNSKIIRLNKVEEVI